VCVEHDGYALRKAQGWWSSNVGTPFPASVNDALDLLEAGHMKPVVAIVTKPDGEWTRIVKVEHGPTRQPGDEPEQEAPTAETVWGDEELPF
jgi:hypothetical protein